MVLKPASGKKRGHDAKNYSKNKDYKICTPAHYCVDLCPKGTVLHRMLFISYACLHAYVNGLASVVDIFQQTLQIFAKTQSTSAKDNFHALPMLSPQYCRRIEFP